MVNISPAPIDNFYYFKLKTHMVKTNGNGPRPRCQWVKPHRPSGIESIPVDSGYVQNVDKNNFLNKYI